MSENWTLSRNDYSLGAGIGNHTFYKLYDCQVITLSQTGRHACRDSELLKAEQKEDINEFNFHTW